MKHTVFPAFTSKQTIPIIISLAMFMEALDTTIINTAIPVMSNGLNVDPINLKIALISYLLSLAIFIPISGWMSDRFGIKRVFISALSLFTLSSLWCGFADNLTALVIARTLQGIGGSLATPVGRLILVRTFPRHELIMTMNRIIMVASIGLMLGPVLGGFITHYFSWRWIFWVNIPVGLFTIIMAKYFIKALPTRKVNKLDFVGFIFFGTSLVTFTFGLSAISETYISDKLALCVILFSIFMLVMYITHSRKQAFPIVKPQLFKERTFYVSIIGNLICRLGFGGMPFLLPLLFQISFKYSPQVSGLLLAPTAAGVLLVKFFTLPLLRFFGYKRLLIINTIITSASLCTFTLVNANTSLYVIGLFTFIYGFLISLQYSSMNTMAYSDVPADSLSAATSVVSTIQQLAQSFGVAVAAIFIRIFSPSPLKEYALTSAVFHQTFLTMGLFTLVSTFIFMRLKPKDGHQMLMPEDIVRDKV